MRPVAIALAAILLAPCILALNCTGSATLQVPAVMGNGGAGALVNATMSLAPGNGTVSFAETPRTSANARNAAENAVSLAFSLANATNTCDTFIDMDRDDSVDSVEGPSAGAPLAVMAYSLITGLPVRQDAVVTGKVDSEGRIWKVGGLHEKALAAAESGKRYFLAARGSMYEAMLLGMAAESGNITVYYVNGTEAAIGFMIYNKTPADAPFATESGEIAGLAPIGASGTAGFQKAALRMLEALNASVDSFPPNGNLSAEAAEYYRADIRNAEALLGKGYAYSAANIALLDYVDAETVRAVLANDTGTAGVKGATGACLLSAPSRQKTDANFEMLAGADLRLGWAEAQLNGSGAQASGSAEDRYAALNELLYADAWCRASLALSEAAGSGGAPIDESAWKDLAESRIAEAEAAGTESPDSRSHVSSARLLYSKGMYGAAVLDAVYVLEGERAAMGIANLSREELEGRTASMLAEKRTSPWGGLYQGHGAYLYATGDTEGAYRALLHARGLDNATADMRDALSQRAAAEMAREPDYSALIGGALLILIGAAIVLALIRMKRQKMQKH